MEDDGRWTLKVIEWEVFRRETTDNSQEHVDSAHQKKGGENSFLRTLPGDQWWLYQDEAMRKSQE